MSILQLNPLYVQAKKTAVEAPKEKAEIAAAETTKEVAEAKTNMRSITLTAKAKAQSGLKAGENANNHAVKSSTALTG